MQYEIIRSDRRTVALEVTRDGRVLVRAPRRMSEKEIERFVASHEEWLQKALEKQQERQEKMPEPDEAERQRCIALAKATIPPLVDSYARRMGVAPTGITITGAQTRFGSCSPKNRLSFSWRLMRYPAEAVEYVVVHELAHIRHKNHGREFYAFIASVLPDYKEREKLLR